MNKLENIIAVIGSFQHPYDNEDILVARIVAESRQGLPFSEIRRLLLSEGITEGALDGAFTTISYEGFK